MEEKITVIVPIYNSSSHLNRCIDSIINQTYKNLEIVLINDGSNDNSLEIINRYKKSDKRIIIIDKENSGVSDSRNKGIDVANGEYITFVDADDWLESDAIKNLYKCIKKNSNYSVVRGKYYKEFCDGSHTISSEKIRPNNNIESLINSVLSGDLYCYMWLLLIKTDVIKNRIYFDTNLAMMEDTIFYLDLLLDGNNIYFSNDITYHYYFNTNSASRSISNCIRNYHNALLVNKIFKDKLENKRKNSKYREKIYNTKTSKSIAETINSLFKYDKKQMKNLYIEICNSSEVMDILDNCDTKNMSKQNSIIVYLLIRKKFYLLKIFLIIRKNLSKIKTLVTRRKDII